MSRYDADFYREHGDTARRSARVVVPMLARWLQPASVVDVGCGTGAWLAVFREQGITDLLGIDGEWLDAGALEIPPHCFLRRELSQPVRLDRHFDLVMSLEVAEHLPKEDADTFVESLVSLGRVILFSAAIPEQGGRHHVNEQWPEYWAQRFARHGYLPLDFLRPRIWNDPGVAWYYAQNLLLFVRQDHLASMPALPPPGVSETPLPLVHPRLYHAKLSALRTWIERTDGLAGDLSRVVPPGASVIMVDQGALGRLASAGYRVSPFPEEDGRYAGPPADDDSALREFERLRDRGAQFMIFAWPAFWWMDHYRGLARELRTAFPVVLENARAIVFDLRGYSRGAPR